MKHTKKICRWVIFWIMVTFVATTSSGSAQSRTDVKRFQEKSLGFSIAYPTDGWEARLIINNQGPLPETVMRRRITLFGPDLARINIDVWNNPEHLTTKEWFERVLGWVRASPELELEFSYRNTDREPAITFIQPRSGKGVKSRSSVLLHGDLVYRLEYIEADGGAALGVYKSILDSFQFTPITEAVTWTPDILLGPPEVSGSGPDDCNCSIYGGCDNCCGISDPGNPFPCCYGNCTWYAYYRWYHTGPQPRPHDLAAVEYHNAGEWYPAAVNAGYATGTTPSVDAIAIWQPNVCQFGWCAGDVGHVGYVIAVDGDNFTFQSMSWDGGCGVWPDGPGQKDTTPNPITGYPNVTFIYTTTPCCCSSKKGCDADRSELQLSATADAAVLEAPEKPLSVRVLSTTEPKWTPSPIHTSRPSPTPTPNYREPVEPQRTPPTSASYRIPKSVFGSGGGEKRSASYVMSSTQGQSTDLNRRQSASYVLVPGYWSSLAVRYTIYVPLVLKKY